MGERNVPSKKMVLFGLALKGTPRRSFESAAVPEILRLFSPRPKKYRDRNVI